MRRGRLALVAFLILSLTLLLSGCGTVNQSPNASFSADQLSGTTLEVSFDASNSSDSDGSILSYSWSFGDGSTGSGPSSTHTYDSSGDYTVELTVTDDDGASDTTSELISVSGSTDDNIETVSDDKLEIIDCEMKVWGYAENYAEIEGQAKNISGGELWWPSVSAKFYNSQDERVGTGYDSTSDLEAGVVWNFEMTTTVEYNKIDHVKVEASG